MYGKMKEHLSNTLAEIKEAGLYKEERLIESAQQAAITVKGKEVLNFCANNYLGLSNHPRLIAAAQKMMDHRGYGMSSVRFICGTQDIHKELEAAISDYFKTEDTILYAACFDANGGVFEPLFTEEDAIISDSLNHHRRCPPMQSQTLPLRQCRYDRTEKMPTGSPDTAFPHHSHRRCIFYGRQCCPNGQNLRSG